jgi:hypothetical protein
LRIVRLSVVLTSIFVSAACLAQSSEPAPESSPTIKAAAETSTARKFHWKGALLQSFAFTGIMHGINVRQYAGPHNNFFERYADSVSDYRWNTWFDGNSGVTNNLGHPLMGAVAGSIELQNDPTGRTLHMSKDSRYWDSRLRSLAWAAAFSVQWEIGPLSESSLGNYGKSTWIRDGRVVNGTGLSDLVMTPLGGFGIILGEDAVDNWMLPHADCSLSKKRKVAWAVLTPARSAANLLRLKAPWYRDSRANELCSEISTR